MSRSDASDDAAEVATLKMMQTAPLLRSKLSRLRRPRSSTEQPGSALLATFEALNYLASYLSGVPGRKNLLWFSSSFPVAYLPHCRAAR